MRTFFTRILPLSLTILLPFLAGLIILSEDLYSRILAIILLAIAIVCVFIAERFSLSVKGNGFKNMTVGPRAPKKPSKNDVWIDTSDQ